MKRTNVKRLLLGRETLGNLSRPDLGQAAGQSALTCGGYCTAYCSFSCAGNCEHHTGSGGTDCCQ